MKDMRKQKILEYLKCNGSLTVEVAMKILSASAPTIRRDFNELASTGEVKRFYGGIKKLGEGEDPSIPFFMRQRWFVETKRTLAAAVFEELPRLGSIFIDGGTTTAHLSMFLDSPELKIITNSLALAQSFNGRFQSGGGPEILLSGGWLNYRSSILLGPDAVRSISRYHADVAVISGTALDNRFVYDNRDDAAEIQRSMIANSDKLIVVADISKFGKNAFCQTIPVEEIDLLVTNFSIEQHEVISSLLKKGVKVKICGETKPSS